MQRGVFAMALIVAASMTGSARYVQLQAQTAAQAGNKALWVAFDASFLRAEPGERRVVGWFHRGSDGSTREESNADGPDQPVVLILNVSTLLQYTFERGAWTSNPLHLPPNGLRPDTSPRNPRLFTAVKPVEGFELLRFINPQGVVQLQAPALNYFPLSIEKPNGGRERYSNVAVREQPAELFLPPPGASVLARTDDWRGPLWYPAGQAPPK